MTSFLSWVFEVISTVVGVAVVVAVILGMIFLFTAYNMAK